MFGKVGQNVMRIFQKSWLNLSVAIIFQAVSIFKWLRFEIVEKWNYGHKHIIQSWKSQYNKSLTNLDCFSWKFYTEGKLRTLTLTGGRRLRRQTVKLFFGFFKVCPQVSVLRRNVNLYLLRALLKIVIWSVWWLDWWQVKVKNFCYAQNFHEYRYRRFWPRC